MRGLVSKYPLYNIYTLCSLFINYLLLGLDMKKNYVQTINSVVSGLNFLIPKQWWQEFLRINDQINHISMLSFPQRFPLDFLQEIDLIEFSQDSKRSARQLAKPYQTLEEGRYQNWLNQAQKDLKNHNNDVENQEASAIAQRYLKLLEHSKESDSKQLDLIIRSPFLKLEQSVNYCIDQDSWVVVCPQVYKFIWDHEVGVKNKIQKNVLTALAILVDFRGSFFHQESFRPLLDRSKLEYVSFYAKNFDGYDFLFEGYIDSQLNIRSIFQFLCQGVFKILKLSIDVFHSFDQIEMIMGVQTKQPQKQYYFQMEEDEVRHSNHFYRNFDKLQNQILENFHPHMYVVTKLKQIKRQREFSRIQSSFSCRKIFKPNQIQRASSKQQKSFKRIPLQMIAEQQNNNATDIDTASASNNPESEVKQISINEFTRIPHRLWNVASNPDALRKLAQIRINNSCIHLPFSSSSQSDNIYFRDKSHRKVPVLNKCNKVIVRDNVHFENQQKSQYMEIEPPQSVLLVLDKLCKKMMGLQIEEEKVEQIPHKSENVKEKDEFESGIDSKTCKNQDLEQLDIEESPLN